MEILMGSTDDGWTRWSKHVLLEIERLNSCMLHLDEQVRQLSIEIAMLKVKSGAWGLVGGSIPVLLALAYKLLSKHP